MAFDPVEDLKMALIAVLNHSVPLNNFTTKKTYDYKDQRAEYYRGQVKSNLQKIKEMTKDSDEVTKKMVVEMENAFQLGDPKVLIGLVGQLSIPKQVQPILKSAYGSLNLPHEIKDDVLFDLKEVEKCLNAEAYRSAIILCGRIMETALHRKYYDFTGKDLLETSPGVGLGTIISKMRESGIQIDPSITQQIHLINNVRIFSVHKKQNAFQPSKEQTQGTLLFTIDILKKLF